ncbi:conditioned medium-induced protein 4 [Halobacterium rubrum]|uniref:conditioned medium-induced protein 4 n=1 Tax=Halobacterium TaxID=2239 RepID=UPI001F260B0A|nr:MULTISPECIES: conditioned medium-induced protein 4 [Halobacterium]MDH5018842.1 conditioned medium-induced protein 4 [Halobacterium rubrum]
MDEKTEELRDIFQSVADDDTVTESQADSHGSLASETDVEDRLNDTVATMRDRLDFRTDLDTDALTTVVRQFYAGDSDADIAGELDDDAADPETIRAARLDLHLVRDDDAPVALDDVRAAADDPTDPDLATVVDAIDADPEDAETALGVLRVRNEIQRVNDRYRAEFENALRDRELTERLTATVHEDGLDDATEGQETDVDL